MSIDIEVEKEISCPLSYSFFEKHSLIGLIIKVSGFRVKIFSIFDKIIGFKLRVRYCPKDGYLKAEFI